MIVITLSKVPPSLRGTLTKWCQEIQTGVFVGRFSARIREALWERISRDIGSGEATMVYHAQNELGYEFRTTRQDRIVVDYEGIPLMMTKRAQEVPVKYGFSNAAKFRKAKKYVQKRVEVKNKDKISEFIALDIETTGLNRNVDRIIQIGAVHVRDEDDIEEFECIIHSDLSIPTKITRLTGIDDKIIKARGVQENIALTDLRKFVGTCPILGFNLKFDDEFISKSLHRQGQQGLDNRLIDLLPKIKKWDKFLESYKLGTVLAHYEIVNERPHNALFDAKATAKLAIKLMKNGKLRF